jgi:AraC-like DNA-binding protein
MKKHRSSRSALLLDTMSSIGLEVPEVLELLDHADGIAFFMKDPEGRFVWVNVPWLVMLGQNKARQEIIGRTDPELFYPLLVLQYRLDDEQVLRGERIISRIELVGRFDHTARWYATTKIPLRDRAGRIVGTAGTCIPVPGKLPEALEASPVSAAVGLIMQRYAEPLNNAELAQACNMSTSVFERKFADAYGITPHNYIRNVRVRLSCQALVFSPKRLSEIAMNFGFADQSHFTNEFHRLMGETPGAYRLRFQSKAPGAARPPKPESKPRRPTAPRRK